MRPAAPGDPTLMLPFAHGGPVLDGRLRAVAEDFVVEEELGYTASGDGEHVFLTLRKRERNTHDVARQLASLAGVPQVAVGYAGLKDRNAVTTQHFTVQLPGREAPDWSAIEDESLQILGAERHNRKIRRGSLRGNRFRIRIRAVTGERGHADALLARIAARGVPNFFGSQRFGRDGNNLLRVAELFAGRGRKPNREQRGLLLSAARAALFNQVLQARVLDASWDRALDGDVMLLGDSSRQFLYDPDDATLPARMAQLQVHPGGPLCGRESRSMQPAAAARAIEQAALADSEDWIAALARLGLDADRRAMRLAVEELAWQWSSDDLEISFRLTSGAYATAVLRELLKPGAAADGDD